MVFPSDLSCLFYRRNDIESTRIFFSVSIGLGGLPPFGEVDRLRSPQQSCSCLRLILVLLLSSCNIVDDCMIEAEADVSRSREIIARERFRGPQNGGGAERGHVSFHECWPDIRTYAKSSYDCESWMHYVVGAKLNSSYVKGEKSNGL